MSYALVTHAMAQPLPPARRAVLLTLADMANHAGLCWPSISTLAEKCCMSVRSIFAHLKALEGAGLLERRTRTGRSSVYTLAFTGGADTCSPPPAEPHGTGNARAQTAPPVATDEATAPATSQAISTSLPATQTPTATDLAPLPPACLTVDSVVAAMRAAGLPGAYDCPELVNLVATASDVDEFTCAAAHAAQRKKGFAWALARVAGRRRDAASGCSSRPAYVRPADVARATVPGRRGRDPVLTQIEAESAKAAPPSPTIRQRLAQLRAAFANGADTHTTQRGAR